MMYKPKHFRLKELFPINLVQSYAPGHLLRLLDGKLLYSVDQLREYLNREIYINTSQMQCRGFRDCFTCGEVGAKLSPHRVGKAFDFNVEGMEIEEVKQIIVNKQHLFSGIRRMEMNTTTWVHVDSFEHNGSTIHLFVG